MSRVCDISGKRPLFGHKVSHSNRKAKKKFYPNLQTQRFYIPEEDKWVTLKVSTSVLKTINQKGISYCLDKLKSKANLSR